MFIPYKEVDIMLDFISEPNKSNLKRLLSENLGIFTNARGSSNNHQAWRGGYLDHVKETMNIVTLLHASLATTDRDLPKLEDALLVMFLHDIEKPWKYLLTDEDTWTIHPSMATKQAQHHFRKELLDSYNIQLNDEQQNALKYVEGELDDYSNKERKMGRLAALCHMADIASARLWFDYPV
jgi:hypothetical protein